MVLFILMINSSKSKFVCEMLSYHRPTLPRCSLHQCPSIKRVWPTSSFCPPCLPAHWTTSFSNALSSGLSGIDIASVQVGSLVRNRGTYVCGDSRVFCGAGALGEAALLYDGCSGVLRVRFLACLCTSAPCGSSLYFNIATIYKKIYTCYII